MKLQELINDICKELEDSSGNKQRKRYLQEYLKELSDYQEHHPNAIDVPTSLQLFCDLNPNNPKCKINDD